MAQRSDRQIKKLRKKNVVYKNEKIFNVVTAHSTDIRWWNAVDLPSTKKFMSADDADRQLGKLPVGSYIIFFERNRKEKRNSWQYIMKNHCNNCTRKCGNKKFKMTRKFGKDFVIKVKQPTQCELKNKFKGLVYWGNV